MLSHPKWPMESTSTRMPAPPQGDGLATETVRSLGLRDHSGVLLETTPQTIAVASLSEEEREARIAAQQARVAAEMEAAKPKPCFAAEAKHRASFPPELKVANCAGCSKLLLGESQEPLRDRARRALPPPVAERMFGGRPYCKACVQAFEDDDRYSAAWSGCSR